MSERLSLTINVRDGVDRPGDRRQVRRSSAVSVIGRKMSTALVDEQDQASVRDRQCRHMMRSEEDRTGQISTTCSSHSGRCGLVQPSSLPGTTLRVSITRSIQQWGSKPSSRSHHRSLIKAGGRWWDGRMAAILLVNLSKPPCRFMQPVLARTSGTACSISTCRAE